MKRICVFAGSSRGAREDYAQAAERLARELVTRGYGVVFGGGKVGMMGVLADATLAAGGEVIGVIPKALLEKEVAHGGLTELRVVASMHERKAMMADLSEGFIALPGGLGTLEEFFEVLTWAQLGLHPKPCGLLNVSGYYDRLLEFLDLTVEERFVKGQHRALVITSTSPTDLLERFATYRPPQVEKWIDRAAS
ncbi:MAG TPA: TIGR00730 family Rossman fold protein [Steroidobacteraceae bacterium]|nr:TIGR00730 family Rossman fold protein [Steroidobacteraceae bacterium]